MGNEDAIPSMTDPITGRAMGLFTAQYEHDGATWGLDFWAYDQDDANAKLAAIRAGATMDGLVQHIIPAN